MKSLADQTKQALSEMAAGDMRAVPGVEASPAAASHKWIALGVGDTLPGHVMDYVIGACRRMQADLLLLAVDPARARGLLAAYLPELSGIEWRVEQLANASAAAVMQTLERQHGVLFAVSGVENDPVHPLPRVRRGPRSPVPVVLVTPKHPEAAPHSARNVEP